MSEAASKQDQPIAATSQAFPSSTVPLERGDLSPASLHHEQASRSTVSIAANCVTVSDGTRDRDLPQEIQDEVKRTALALDESPEVDNHQGRVKPETKLYSPTDLQDHPYFDPACWAELGPDEGLELAKKIFPHLLETSKLKIHIPSSMAKQKARNLNTQPPKLHLRLRHGVSSECPTLWEIASTNATPSSLAVQVCNWIELNWHTKVEKFGNAARFHLPIEHPHRRKPPGDSCGKIWWITDTPYEKPSRTSRELVNIDLLVLFVHLYCLFRKSRNSQGGVPAEIDETCLNLARDRFEEFVLMLANHANPSAERLLCEYDKDSCLKFDFHLRHFAPRAKPMPAKNLLFVPERQAAKIPYYDPMDMRKKVLDLEERALSLSLTMLPRCGTFFLFVIGDEGVPVTARGYTDGYLAEDSTLSAAYFKMPPPETNYIFPWHSGNRAGLSHLLLSLCTLLDAWESSWNATLDAVDSTVRFKMSHTLDEKWLQYFMFDNPGSMDLSRQYFTVLQILRITSEWIDTTVADWEKMEQGINEVFAFVESVGLPEYDRSPTGYRLSEVTNGIRLRAGQLQDRVKQKTEEVKSLRDGLFNATSLKEAMGGMQLNRAIYMFTAVTILYTPLGFMAGLWALPIFNTTKGGDNIHPSVLALVATFVIIPIATYFVCGRVAWYYAPSDSKSRVKEWARGMLAKLNGDSEGTSSHETV